MKKGNKWPHATARWIAGPYPDYYFTPPTWIRSVDLYAVLIADIGGIPFPTDVIADNLSDAQWAYAPDPGGIIWRGTWNNGLVGGEWSYMQRTDPVRGCINRFSIIHDDGLLNPRVTYDSSTHDNNGEWHLETATESACDNRLPGVTPWAFVININWELFTYADVRAIGHNPDDIHPLTWNDSGVP